jgi:hypothetical protein
VIRARGGPLAAFVRQGEATVHRGFPGTWRWRSAYLSPDQYALSIETAAEPFHYLFDGTAVRAFAGTQPIAEDPRPTAPLRTHARFTAVVNLDALRLPRYRVEPLTADALPPGAREGLIAVEVATGARFRLAFGDDGLLVLATGPLDLNPLGAGDVTARFTDFRRVGGLRLPFHTSYVFGGALLVDDTALAVCPNPPEVTPETFVDPVRLPDCGA